MMDVVGHLDQLVHMYSMPTGHGAEDCEENQMVPHGVEDNAVVFAPLITVVERLFVKLSIFHYIINLMPLGHGVLIESRRSS